jgi:hypothetical protein
MENAFLGLRNWLHVENYSKVACSATRRRNNRNNNCLCSFNAWRLKPLSRSEKWYLTCISGRRW